MNRKTNKYNDFLLLEFPEILNKKNTRTNVSISLFLNNGIVEIPTIRNVEKYI